jgi:hypothetical protein
VNASQWKGSYLHSDAFEWIYLPTAEEKQSPLKNRDSLISPDSRGSPYATSPLHLLESAPSRCNMHVLQFYGQSYSLSAHVDPIPYRHYRRANLISIASSTVYRSNIPPPHSPSSRNNSYPHSISTRIFFSHPPHHVCRRLPSPKRQRSK